MQPRLILLAALLPIVLGIPTASHAELVATLFSWDGGDSDRISPYTANADFYEITTDSLVAVGLPVLPENGEFVISSVIHTDGDQLTSNEHLYGATDYPEFAGRTDLFIQCSFLYLNTTSQIMSVDFVCGGNEEVSCWMPTTMDHWESFESPLLPFVPGPGGYLWVSLSAFFGWLHQGYLLYDNISIKLYDTTGVVVGEMGVGGLKASY